MDTLLLLNSGQCEDIGSHGFRSDQILKRNNIRAFSPCHIHEEIRNRLLFYKDHVASAYTLHYKMLLKIFTVRCTLKLTVYQAGHVGMDNYNLSYSVLVRTGRIFEFRILIKN